MRTQTQTWMIATVIGGAVGVAAMARAQPVEPEPDAPVANGSGSGNGNGNGSGNGDGNGSEGSGDSSGDTSVGTPQPVTPPAKPRAPDPRVRMPQVLTTPTGWLLPAAVIYSRSGLDTGGGVVSDNRVGLGDVAEFGVSTIDQIRAKNLAGDRGDQLQPYFAATFRMGVSEDRLFAGQPGIVLGFRKSFENDSNGFASRIAELTVVASEKLGPHAAIHVGGAFWDASLQGSTGPENDLHDHSIHSLGDQMRAFGALEVEPLDRSEIMVALDWAPEFCYACAPADQIRLRPELAWGVRYDVASWLQLESGVRVPDIGNANLLDAQIFGAVTFLTWSLRHAVDGAK